MITDITEAKKSEAVGLLHRENLSCVIVKGDRMVKCRERGVKDLYRLLTTEPDVLSGAFVADKVVGKGAAALMILGHIAGLWADVISEPALKLLETSTVDVSYGERVENIVNRAGTGICPVESLTQKCATARDCLPLIRDFIENQNNNVH